MPMRPDGPRAAPSGVAELDVLRGFAAILMVLNHAGLRLLGHGALAPDAEGFAVFIGSHAPVLFFFATGFGSGVSTRPSAWGSTFYKAALLVIADQFLAWKTGAAWGLDFLAFIGISTVAVAAVARLPRPALSAVVLALVLLGVRYALGGALRPVTADAPLLAWVTGLQGAQRVGYPLAPWLSYALFGFALARVTVAGGVAGGWQARAGTVGVALIGVAGAVAAVCVPQWLAGAEFFRWSVVNFAFYVSSLGVLAGAIGASLLLQRWWPRGAESFALRGAASFFVIPLHYVLIELADTTGADVPFAISVAAICVAAFALARGLARGVDALQHTAADRSAAPVALAVLAITAMVAVGWREAMPATGLLTVCTLGQIAAGWLLAARKKKSAPRVEPVGKPLSVR